MKGGLSCESQRDLERREGQNFHIAKALLFPVKTKKIKRRLEFIENNIEKHQKLIEQHGKAIDELPTLNIMNLRMVDLRQALLGELYQKVTDCFQTHPSLTQSDLRPVSNTIDNLKAQVLSLESKIAKTKISTQKSLKAHTTSFDEKLKSLSDSLSKTLLSQVQTSLEQTHCKNCAMFGSESEDSEESDGYERGRKEVGIGGNESLKRVTVNIEGAKRSNMKGIMENEGGLDCRIKETKYLQNNTAVNEINKIDKVSREMIKSPKKIQKLLSDITNAVKGNSNTIEMISLDLFDLQKSFLEASSRIPVPEITTSEAPLDKIEEEKSQDEKRALEDEKFDELYLKVEKELSRITDLKQSLEKMKSMITFNITKAKNEQKSQLIRIVKLEVNQRELRNSFEILCNKITQKPKIDNTKKIKEMHLKSMNRVQSSFKDLYTQIKQVREQQDTALK
ncbi:unnamed protein product [Moneuplotes crassus]|uniref:Uncharacterized protein n=1 Tax=Euplotes crassus TaxID=5936 RepID=A0AAD1X212_EUPCR|nr:unnamed protein product [Moneuplotes crassus]